MASRRQLQSILGLLLYVHKCVKPARIFLNRMLELLRASNGRQKILLTPVKISINHSLTHSLILFLVFWGHVFGVKWCYVIFFEHSAK